MLISNNLAKTTGPGRLDIALEVIWLLFIFLLPVYFNPLGYQVFYFAKALLLQFGVCLLLGLYLARWFLAGRNRGSENLWAMIKRSPLQAAVLVLALIWVVSTVFSIMPEASFWGSLARKNGLSTLIAWVVLFFIVAQGVRNKSQLYRALVVLIVSAGIVSLFGILEFADPRLLAWLSRNGRISATDGNPLSLSCFIAMVIPANLALLIIAWYGLGSNRRKAVKVIGFLLVFCLQIICLYLAQYSITILLFIPGIFIFFLLAGIYLKRKATVALSAAVLIVLIFLAITILGQTLMSRTDNTAVVPSNTDISMAGRTGLNTLGLRAQKWECAVNVIVDSPEVPLYQDNLHLLRRWMGYGPEMLVIASQAEYPVSMKSQDTYNSMLLGQPENHYLYLAATIGIIGLAAFLTMIIVFFYLGFRLLSRFPEREVICLASAFIAGVAQYCVYLLFNPTAILPEFMFWLILALMTALIRMEMPGYEELPAPANDGLEGTDVSEKAHSGKLRKAIAVSVVILFTGIGFSLTFSPALADIKLNSALHTWSSDTNRTMANLSEAANLEPGEAAYYGYIGSYAYVLAITAGDAAEKSRLLDLSTAAYGVAGKREPYLAYWSYTTGDVYSYWAGHIDPGKWKDALRYYERADTLLPDDAVILNKWALALMQNGDYEEAGRKLTQSQAVDREWIQTTYLNGLLEVYQSCYCTAGNCFIYPVRGNPANLGSYMGLCKQLSLYGGISKVVEGLKVYAGCHRDDWLGFALLGIAEVYDGNIKDGSTAFLDAAGRITGNDAGLLKEIVSAMAGENNDFQVPAKDIQARLASVMEE